MPTWFIDETIGGRACVLCLLEPNWSTRPKITHSFETLEAEGDTGIETREPGRSVMQLVLEYRYTFARDVAQEFLNAIRDLYDKRLVLPLVPDRLPADIYAAERIYASQQWANFDSVSGAYALNADGGHPESVGLVMGRLVDRPRISAMTDLDGTVLVRLQQDSPWSCRVEPNALEMLAWSLDPDWAAKVPEDSTVTKLRTRRLGQGGELAIEYPDSPAKRVQAAGFTLQSREEIRQVLTFWSAKRGRHGAFTVPQTFRPGWDLVDGHEPALQAKFAQDELQLEYRTQETARTQLAFQQVLTLVGGEPDQERPSRARLYKFWWDGSATLKTYTDWWEPLVFGGSTYEPKSIEHRAEAETLRPGTADWEIMVEDFDGNPLRAFSLLALERRLKLEIYECDPANPAGAAMLFAGEISRAPSKGRFYTAPAVLMGGALKRLVPGFYCQQPCNHTLYDDLCGVSIAANKVVGTIAAIADTVIDITCGSAAAADWFAPGYVTFGVGDNAERRFVIRSTPIVGGQRVTIHRPLVTSAIAAAAELLPGCDSQYAGGCAKFANQDNFGAAPWHPDFIDSVSTGYKTKVGK